MCCLVGLATESILMKPWFKRIYEPKFDCSSSADPPRSGGVYDFVARHGEAEYLKHYRFISRL